MADPRKCFAVVEHGCKSRISHVKPYGNSIDAAFRFTLYAEINYLNLLPCPGSLIALVMYQICLMWIIVLLYLFSRWIMPLIETWNDTIFCFSGLQLFLLLKLLHGQAPLWTCSSYLYNRIMQANSDSFVVKTLDRKTLWEMHTPQVSLYEAN